MSLLGKGGMNASEPKRPYRTLAVGVIGVVLVASAYWIIGSDEDAGPTSGREPLLEPVVQSPRDVPDAAPVRDDGSAARERAASDVRALSQTFRHSTFLIAIRRAGYYCDEVVSATESAVGGWVASCADKGGYTLSVRTVNSFDVRPIGHYLDGVAPRVVEREFEQR